MKKIKNLIVLIIFILLIVNIRPIISYSDIIIKGTEVEDDKKDYTKTDIKVYNIALKTSLDQYELSSDFIDCGYSVEEIVNANASELTSIAENISNYAEQSNAEYYIQNDKLCFDISIEIRNNGIYLICIDDIEYEDLIYSAQPIICEAEQNKNIEVKPKFYLGSSNIEEETTIVIPPSITVPNVGDEFPNTGFNIVPVYIFIIIGVFSLITAFGIRKKNPEHKKYKFFICIVGILMIFVAIYMLGNNYYKEQDAITEMNIAKNSIKEVINKNESINDDFYEEILVDDFESELPPEPVCVVDGKQYIGLLNIPSLSLELPIGYNCDANTLKSSPGRFYGAVNKDTFVIGAHHYGSQFGYINQLHQGDEIHFVDLNGNICIYNVASITQVQPSQVKDVCESGYDLALFTCNYNASKRIIVYCQKYE